MIRASLLKAVYEAIEAHQFLTLEDFRVSEYENERKEPCLSIQYRYDATFFFNVHIQSSKRKPQDEPNERYFFGCSVSPGRESAKENLTAVERSGLLSEIREWLIRLHEDVLSVPAVRQFEAHAKAIEEIRQRLEELPDEPLSRSDIEQFREALDRVKADITEQIKAAVDDKEELKRKVQELGRDIEFLKHALDSMTKRRWAEVFWVRTRRWKERFSLRQLAAGVRVLKALLPANYSDELDIVATVVEGTAAVLDSPAGGAKEPAGHAADGAA